MVKGDSNWYIWYMYVFFFIDISGMNKSSFCNFLCAPTSTKKNCLRHKYQGSFLYYRFNQSVQSPTRHLESEYTDWLNKKTLYVINSQVASYFTDSTNQCTLIQGDVKGFAPIGWICKRGSYLGIYDVESFFCGDIGAQRKLQMPDLFMPELIN